MRESALADGSLPAPCPLRPPSAPGPRSARRPVAQQRQLKEETLSLCGWLLLFSTCPLDDWSDEQLLTLYRARWQIELAIKRLKQLLPLAQLRGQSSQTNEATLLALLVASALQQNVASQLRQGLSQALLEWRQQHLLAASASQASETPSPTQATIRSWTLNALSVQTLRQVVQGYYNAARLRACLPLLLRYLGHRRKRAHQESAICSQLLSRLAPPPHNPSLLLFKCLIPSCDRSEEYERMRKQVGDTGSRRITWLGSHKQFLICLQKNSKRD